VDRTYVIHHLLANPANPIRPWLPTGAHAPFFF